MQYVKEKHTVCCCNSCSHSESINTHLRHTVHTQGVETQRRIWLQEKQNDQIIIKLNWINQIKQVNKNQSAATMQYKIQINSPKLKGRYFAHFQVHTCKNRNIECKACIVIVIHTMKIRALLHFVQSNQNTRFPLKLKKKSYYACAGTPVAYSPSVWNTV